MRLACVLLALAACRAPSIAGDEDCAAYHEKIAVLVGKKQTGTGINPELGAWCRQRGVTTEYVACVRRSTTLDDAERCRPRSDARPSSQRPDAAACDALTAHIDALVALAMPSAKPSSEAARRVSRMECLRWETRARIECQVATASLAQLETCGL